MLSEVAGPCRSSSWQKQEVSNEVPLPTEKAKYAKIHTATSSVQLYLLPGRSSSCELYQVEVLCSGSVLQLCESELKISQYSIEVVSLGPQVPDDSK